MTTCEGGLYHCPGRLCASFARRRTPSVAQTTATQAIGRLNQHFLGQLEFLRISGHPERPANF